MARKRRKQLPAEPFRAQITALSHDGRGIAHIEGKTTFIIGALPGEDILFKYTKQRGSHDEGQVVEVLKASDERAEPACPHFLICGGCRLQHMNSTLQIAEKQKTLLEQLQHFAKLQPQEILTPLTGPQWAYRRKARLGVRYVHGKGRVLVGFREYNGRYLADMHVCKVLHPAVGERLTALSELIATLSIYQDIPQIEVAIGEQNNTDEVALNIRHLKEFTHDDIEKLIAFAQQYDFQIYLQSKGIDTIQRLWPEIQNGEKQRLHYHLPDFNLELLFHPSDFTQVNADINRAMVTCAIDFLDPQADEHILDLFCGLGNFSLALATRAATVTGVEGDSAMVKRAQENAAHNDITNAVFYAADLFADFTSAVWAQQKYAKLLIDPPRTGALEICQQIPIFAPQRIVYVSCNPATLARDAGILVNEHGYHLRKTGVMDMFPHTQHVESIAVFER